MKMEDLLPFITEAFSQNKTFTIPITGTSMLPLLIAGKDTVELSGVTAKENGLSLMPGDLPLYRRKDGSFVLHRIVGIENGTYTMCGDNQFILEKGIEESQIIGVVTAINKDGKTIPVTDKKYSAYVKKQVKNIKYRYPKRRLRKKISDTIRKNNAVKAVAFDETPDKDAIKEDILLNAENLIKILKFVLTGENPGDVSSWNFGKIKKLSDIHHVTGFAAQGVLKLDGVPAEVKSGFKKELFRTAARYTAQENEVRKLSGIFDSEKIFHCFLKGTKIAKYYDVPESRFMLDADIYTEKSRIRDACRIMEEQGYKNTLEDTKDIAFTKDGYLNIELHKDFKYDYDGDYEYYKNAADKLIRANDETFELKMTNEDFYVYALSHTAHHFSASGTGLRSVIDHWYLRKNLLPLCDGAKITEYLQKSGLNDFSKKMNELCDCWFGQAEKSDLIKEIGDYIILSGLYGTEKNTYLNGVVKRGVEDSVSGFLLGRIFPDLSRMKKRYDILNKIPFLLPVFWIIRIFSSLSLGGRLKKEISAAADSQKSDIDSRSEFFKSVGL